MQMPKGASDEEKQIRMSLAELDCMFRVLTNMQRNIGRLYQEAAVVNEDLVDLFKE
jgi:hypothetical protein